MDLILDKLPDVLDQKQKNKKIENLLTRMKKINLIKNQGSNRTPNWVRKLNQFSSKN